MVEDSPFVHTIHSGARYGGYGGRSDLTKKEIGFNADFDEFGGAPMPQFLPEKVPCTWQKVTSSVDLLECGKFYADADNGEKGWKPNATTLFPVRERTVPRFLHLPAKMGWVCAKGDCTPWELRLSGGELTLSSSPLLESEDLSISGVSPNASERILSVRVVGKILTGIVKSQLRYFYFC